MKSMICAAALSALCLMSGPVHADEPVTVPIVSADWTRRVELSAQLRGSQDWTHQLTKTARGTYPDLPEWSEPRMGASSFRSAKTKKASYALTVEDPVTERRHVLMTSEEAWTRAAESGEIEVLRDDDGTLRVKDTDTPSPRIDMRNAKP